MAKDKLTDYSATNASNTDIGGINIDEGMLPSAVNNALREQMTHLKNFSDGTDGINVLSLADDDASAAIKFQAPSAVTSDTTFTLPDGDGADGQALITDGSGTLAWAYPYGNRNVIINGAFQCWQRATSVTTSGSGTFSADRWASNAGASTVFSRSTDVPTGFQFSISVAGSTYTGIRTRIEAADCKKLAGQQVTFSWYAKRTAGTGDMKTFLGHASAEDNFATVTSIEEVVNTASASVSSNWARYTYTVTLPANAANGLHFVIFNGSASGSVTTLYTGVQLELGSQATPFEHRSFADELARCQRYYFKFLEGGTKEIGVAWYYTASHASFMLRYPTTMRATPTGIDTTGTNFYGIYRAGALDSIDSITFENGSTEQYSAYNASEVSGTAGQAGLIRSTNASAKVEFDAEL